MDVIVKVRDPEENLEEKIKAYKVKKRIKTVVTILAFVFALISSYLLVKLQTYTSLRTLQSYKNKETESSDLKYLQYADGMLKYGRDGIAYINKKGVEQVFLSLILRTTVVISGCSFLSAFTKLLDDGRIGDPSTRTTIISPLLNPLLIST